MLSPILKRTVPIVLMYLILSVNMAGISQGTSGSPGSAQTSPKKGLDLASEKLKCPEYAELAINYFTRVGIYAYFDLNKKVPKWWDDYLKSGFPMMYPADYVTGKPYHRVDKIDLKDTTGFAYHYENSQVCSFEFVFKNEKTGENFSQEIKIRQKPRQGLIFTYNESKRDYCINFFSTYAKIYALKNNGKAPKNLKQMLKGEGTLIEAGWKWRAEPETNPYFVWGMDINKCRIYYITEKISRKVTRVQQVALKPGEQGKSSWQYKEGETIPEDVCVKTRFITADGLYAFYKSFK